MITKRQKEPNKNPHLGEKCLWGLAAVGVSATISVAKILPQRLLAKLGRFLGALGYYLIRPRREIAQQNIKRVYGATLSKKEMRRLAKESFKNISRDTIEIGISYLASPDQPLWEENISVEGSEHLDAALKKGKGVIAVSAHLGNFPMISAKLAVRGYPFSLIAKDPKNIYLVECFKEWRRRIGIGFIPYKPRYRCAAESLKVLRKNGIIFLLIDQNPRKKYGVGVNFFDHYLPTYAGPIVLARRSGAAIVPMFIHRNGDDTETIHILPELTLPKSKDRNQDIVDSLRAINVICEEWIKRYPEQWWWLHRRFRWGKRIAPSEGSC